MNTKKHIGAGVALAVFTTLNSSSIAFGQGSLTPPDAPAPTMKTLDQIEPRIPIATNTTPGDGSTQFIISQPGSYYLTTNLIGVSGKDAISIRSDNVTLDLDGFAMIGAAGGFSGSAINVPSAQKNLCVRNGAVRGWGSTAVLMYNVSASQLERLRVSDSGGSGIYTGNDFAISDCTSISNGLYAILVGGRSKLSGCLGSYSQTGISAGDKTAIQKCICVGNSINGISAGDRVSLSDCTSDSNVGYGISLGDDCAASGCIIANNSYMGFMAGKNGTFNNCRATYNYSYGFQLGSGATLAGCTADYTTVVDGFACGEGTTVQNCSAGFNGRYGFYGGQGSSFNNCSARKNASDGFNVNYAVTLTACTAVENSSNGIVAGGASVLIQNCNTSDNLGDGVSVSFYDQIVGCLCSNNGPNGGTNSSGIHVSGSFNRIDGNHLNRNHNTGLKVDNLGLSNLIVRNSATDNPVAYTIPAGNRNAEVLSGGTAFVSTDPWANFSY